MPSNDTYYSLYPNGKSVESNRTTVFLPNRRQSFRIESSLRLCRYYVCLTRCVLRLVLDGIHTVFKLLLCGNETIDSTVAGCSPAVVGTRRPTKKILRLYPTCGVRLLNSVLTGGTWSIQGFENGSINTDGHYYKLLCEHIAMLRVVLCLYRNWNHNLWDAHVFQFHHWLELADFIFEPIDNTN